MTLFKSFKVVAFLEGISYILLLFMAVPVKYLAGDESYVKMLGMPHGVLFMAYIVLAIMLAAELKWNKKTIFIVLIASIIPFGTFYVDRRYLKSKN